jgi:hypothetical protein
MEPADTKVRYAIYAKVSTIRESPQGWFVHFAGSHESVFLGPEKLDFNVGDKVKITFERTSDAKS